MLFVDRFGGDSISMAECSQDLMLVLGTELIEDWVAAVCTRYVRAEYRLVSCDTIRITIRTDDTTCITIHIK